MKLINSNKTKNQMKTKILALTVLSIAVLIIGCQNDDITAPQDSITEIHTNGTFTATSSSQIKGTMFVTDQNNNPVSGLNGGNVSAVLRWNGGSSSANGNADLSSNGGKINVASAMTMDYSGSMGSQQIACMETACTTYVNMMKTTDISEIVKFASDVTVVQAFTGDKGLLNNSILASWPGTGGSTSLYQAIYQATGDAISQPSAQYVRSVIAFTDGEENNSTVTRDQMINYAISNGIPVYTIGLLDNPGSNGAIDLKNIADTSGAFYFYSHPDSCSNLNSIYTTISGQLAGSYTLTVDWQGTLPSSGTTVEATITTTRNNLSSSYRRYYVIP